MCNSSGNSEINIHKDHCDYFYYSFLFIIILFTSFTECCCLSGSIFKHSAFKNLSCGTCDFAEDGPKQVKKLTMVILCSVALEFETDCNSSQLNDKTSWFYHLPEASDHYHFTCVVRNNEKPRTEGPSQTPGHSWSIHVESPGRRCSYWI